MDGRGQGKPPGLPKTGGRTKGTPNKATREVKEVIESVLPRDERYALLAKFAKKGNYKALELLCYYADGKPKEYVDVNHSGGIKWLKDDIA